MSNMSAIIFRNYVDSMRVAAPYARPLAHELTNAAPTDADAIEQAALTRITQCASEVEEVLREREWTASETVRDLRTEFTRQWGGLESALIGASRVPAHLGDRGRRAAVLHALLFPDGLTFVTYEAKLAWSAATRRLETIERDGKRAELEAIVGADIVTAVYEATDAIRDALGLGSTAREVPSKTALMLARIAFGRAIGKYCRILSAKVDEEVATSVERFRRAVAPIDAYRAAHPVVRGTEDVEDIEEEEDDVVVPVTPPVVEPVASPA